MKKLFVITICLALGLSAAAQKPSPATLATTKPAATAPVLEPASVPVGTAVRMKLDKSISTSYNVPGDAFSARVSEAVIVDGRTVIPAGASLRGRITRVTEPRRIRGTPTITLRPEAIVLPDGKQYAISAVVVDTDQRPYTDVDDEGRIKAKGHDGSDTKETGVGAAVGGGIGLMAGGGRGALIGAAIGTTATVVHWLVKRRSADLPAGSEIIVELSRPMLLNN